MLSAQLVLNYFQRNNPIAAAYNGFAQFVYDLVTLKSRRRLLKYRQMLELKKLERIEEVLNRFDTTEHMGRKMNRIY